MEDIRLGRKIINVAGLVRVGAGPTLLVDRDPKRVSLIFAPGNGGVFAIQMNWSPDMSVNGGWVWGNTSIPIYLNIKDHGDIVTKCWYGLASPGGSDIYIVQGRLEET